LHKPLVDTAVAALKLHKHALISRYMKASNASGFTQVCTTLGPLALLWWAAVWSLSISWWLTGALILVMSLFTLRLLVLMHECGHGSLFRSQRLNRAFGFAFGVAIGMPQYVWSQHHAFHHATNGDWDKYRGPLTSPSVDEFTSMGRSRQRQYMGARSLPLAPFGGFVYLIFNPRFNWLRGSIGLLAHAVRLKVRQPAISFSAHAASYQTRLWNSSKEYRHMTWNNLVLLSAWVGICAASGAPTFFPIYLISVSIAGGAGIILFTVQHNFEHAYATDSARWDHDSGALHGTSFLQLPRWLNWFTANIAYHHVHHLSARIPNYRLVKCHDDNAHLFTEVRRVKLSEVPRALKCLIWDAAAQRIISVTEYQRQCTMGSPAIGARK
jgi:omega-6 fatty acid desaturase (delta-12 desaturase)